MEIRIRETAAVVSEQEFRDLHPNTSLPVFLTESILDSLGADAVLEGARPTPTRYQVVYRDGVEQVSGQWFTKYSVVDMDPDAVAAKDSQQAKAVRSERDRKLAESDWRVIKSAETGQPIPAEWTVYRQALRDITNQAGFPWEVVWPTEPQA